jgi:hypothetical protein
MREITVYGHVLSVDTDGRVYSKDGKELLDFVNDLDIAPSTMTDDEVKAALETAFYYDNLDNQ